MAWTSVQSDETAGARVRPACTAAPSCGTNDRKRPACRNPPYRGADDRRRGVLKATMQGIGRAVHLRGASLYYYYYFDTRESLYAEIMLEHLHGLARAVCASFDATETLRPRQRLEAMIAAFLGSTLAERNEHRLTLRSADVLNEDGRHAVRVRTRGLADLFGEVLMLAVPGTAPAAAQAAAMSLVAAMSCATLWFHEDGEVTVADYAHMLAVMAMAGAAVAPDRKTP